SARTGSSRRRFQATGAGSCPCSAAHGASANTSRERRIGAKNPGIGEFTWLSVGMNKTSRRGIIERTEGENAISNDVQSPARRVRRCKRYVSVYVIERIYAREEAGDIRAPNGRAGRWSTCPTRRTTI